MCLIILSVHLKYVFCACMCFVCVTDTLRKESIFACASICVIQLVQVCSIVSIYACGDWECLFVCSESRIFSVHHACQCASLYVLKWACAYTHFACGDWATLLVCELSRTAYTVCLTVFVWACAYDSICLWRLSVFVCVVACQSFILTCSNPERKN